MICLFSCESTSAPALVALSAYLRTIANSPDRRDGVALRPAPCFGHGHLLSGTFLLAERARSASAKIAAPLLRHQPPKHRLPGPLHHPRRPLRPLVPHRASHPCNHAQSGRPDPPYPARAPSSCARPSRSCRAAHSPCGACPTPPGRVRRTRRRPRRGAAGLGSPPRDSRIELPDHGIQAGEVRV